MNKKILISAAVAAVVVIGTGTSYWYSKPKLDPEVQKRIDIIVKGREWNPYGNGKERTPSWKIVTKIPENVPLEKWDTVHKQPQIMFHYGRDGTVYTMNMNGTDVRQLLHRDELGELPYRGADLRSPNGRYLSLRYYTGLANFTCAIFDLKERKTIKKMNSCANASFSQDSQYFYYLDAGVAHRQPIKLDLTTGKASNLLPEKVTIKGTAYYPATQTQTFMINEVLNLLIWSGAKRDSGGDIVKRVQAGFDLKTLKIVEVKSYLAPACQDGFDYNPNRDYFICGYKTREENKVFSSSEPAFEIENAPARNVIKLNAWYFDSKDNQLLRYRQPNEKGMFDIIEYYYGLDIGKGTSNTNQLNNINFFIPKELVKNIDYRTFFPSIPTQEQYDESYQRQLKARKEGK